MIMMIVMPGYYIILIHYIKATSCGCDAGDGKRPPPRSEDTDNRDRHTSPPPRRGLVARTKGEGDPMTMMIVVLRPISPLCPVRVSHR